jgi:hypothetical protein
MNGHSIFTYDNPRINGWNGSDCTYLQSVHGKASLHTDTASLDRSRHIRLLQLDHGPQP